MMLIKSKQQQQQQKPQSLFTWVCFLFAVQAAILVLLLTQYENTTCLSPGMNVSVHVCVKERDRERHFHMKSS